MPATVSKYKPANFKRKGQRDAWDIVLFSGASAFGLRLGAEALRTTLIELVNDVPGAGKAPIGISR